MASRIGWSGSSDAELVRRAAARDPAAAQLLDDRYRGRLNRYARSVLGRSGHEAEDVVQDVLVKAHLVLSEGRGPDDLRPWLYRLTRNRAIDELRRARWGEGSLDDTSGEAAVDHADPPEVLHRRESVKAVAQDLADLPVAQRNALLSRVVDGDSPQRSAERLGVSVEAAQMLVVRARANLVRVRAARRAGGDLETQLLLMAPPGSLLSAVGLAKLVGFGGGKVAAAVAAATVTITAAGGLVVAETKSTAAGAPAPFSLTQVSSIIGERVRRGDTIPDGTAVLSTTARIGAGTPDRPGRRVVTLTCPAGMRYAGRLLAGGDAGDDLEYHERGGMTSANGGRSVSFQFADRALAAPQSIRLRVLCRAPGRGGSLIEHPRLPHADEGRGEICTEGYVFRDPEHVMTGTVFKNQKVTITRKASRSVFMVTDTHIKGWVKIESLCPGWTLAKRER